MTDVADLIADLIAHHEGCRNMPYVDTTGHVTIGIGRNLTDNGVTEAEIQLMFEHDLDVAKTALELNCAPWFQALDEVRQAVLIDMCFNMGWQSLSGFAHTLGCVSAGNYAAAADSMLQSKWAAEVGSRATEDAAMMRSGLWNT